MVSSAIAQIFALLLELVRISHISDHDKDLEILVLSYQLSIADRKLNRTKHIQKLTLAVLAARLKSRTKSHDQPAAAYIQNILSAHAHPLAQRPGEAQVDLCRQEQGRPPT
jgi:hypothetical protein